MGKFFDVTDAIEFAVHERVARVTLNRPDKRNALTPPMIASLHDALIEADARNDVNVIVLQGAGRDFCAGYDLTGVYAGIKSEADAAAAGGAPAGGPAIDYRTSTGTFDNDCWSLEFTQRQTMALFDLHKPVIAKVHGNCLAGGTDLALMCDMVLAADDAKIGFPATRANGTPPNHMWVYHVGPQWAKRLLMTGDSLSGRDAARIGLVLDSVPTAGLDHAVDELARRMSHVDAELLSAHKRIVNLALELAGARTLQRLAAESDARAHLSQGPRRQRFKADMAAHGLKEALKNRDAPFGDGVVKIHRPAD
jgi:enoyl-CoA hydratase/carnithine racemase